MADGSPSKGRRAIIVGICAGFLLACVVLNLRPISRLLVGVWHHTALQAEHGRAEPDSISNGASDTEQVVAAVILAKNTPSDRLRGYHLTGDLDVKVLWIVRDWAYGKAHGEYTADDGSGWTSEDSSFLARKRDGEWVMLNDQIACGSMSQVEQFGIPKDVAERLLEADYFHPELERLVSDVGTSQDSKYYILVDWFQNNWAHGAEGSEGNWAAGFIACKRNGKWRIAHSAQDKRPMSDVKKYNIPDDVAQRLIADGWFDPKAVAAWEAKRVDQGEDGSESLSEGVRISSWTWHKDAGFGGDGAIIAVGQVENYGGTTAEYTKVTVTYSDREGNVLDTASGYTDPANIPPGSKSPFKIYSDYRSGATKCLAQVNCRLTAIVR